MEASVVIPAPTQVLALFGAFHFLFDLMTHFRVQAVVSLLSGGLTLVVFRRWRVGLVGLAVGALLALSLATYFLPAPHVAGRRSLSLLVMNDF